MKSLPYFLFLLVFPTPFLCAQILDSISTSTNGSVNVVVRDGKHLYVGGSFSSGGYATGGAALVGVTNDIPDVNFPQLSGTVLTSIPDGAGGWYVGGSNVSINVGGQAFNKLVHIKADMTVDTDFMPNPNGNVNTLVMDGFVLVE